MNYFSITYLAYTLSRQNSIIARALLKYGYSKLSLLILEYCDPKDVITREQHYFDTLQPPYNIAKVAGASMTGRNHTDELKQLMSEAKSDEIIHCLGLIDQGH